MKMLYKVEAFIDQRQVNIPTLQMERLRCLQGGKAGV